MSNLDILKNGTDTEQDFANSIEEKAKTHTFYSDLITNLNKMSRAELTKTRNIINNENLKDTIDTIFWLQEGLNE